jgi:hypothetical protein
VTTRMLIVCLGIACGVGACAAPAVEEAAPLAEEEAAAPTAEERAAEATPEMLAAALLGDPDAMAGAISPLSGCQAPKTCAPQYGSCGSWSAYSQCSFQCNSDPWCSCGPDIPDQPPCEPNPYDTSALVSYNSFRVCFNAQGQSCTEWRRAFSSYCGC